MTELNLTLETDISLEGLKEMFESITRDYLMAVVESYEEAGYEHHAAPKNVRFLDDLIFSISCAIEDKKTIKPSKNKKL